jgi:serine/threonine-protein kinase
MGVVLRARHRVFGRVVALKLLAAGAFAEPAEVLRFRREVEAVARLDHPNVVPVYDVGEHAGLPYFTMKLLPGSLAQRLRQGPLAPRTAASLVASISRAVHHAHQRGILHRDLKPANVLLASPSAEDDHARTPPTLALAEEPGEVYVADFGLARPAGASALTSTGAVVGTPAYVAPEQARGSHDEVTVASDVYGLGAILYECLTGQPPFKAATPLETLRLVIDADVAPPRSLRPGLDADLETICLKCLRKKPAERYASAAELADDLERYLRREPIRARPIGPVARLWRVVRRQPVVAGLAAALMLVAAAGFVLVLLQWLRAEAALALVKHQRDQTQFALAEAEDARSEAESHLNLANLHADQAEEARQKAEASFRQAHAAVNQCLEASDELRDRPGLQKLHRKLVQSARAYYQDFLKDRGGDRRLRRELADTHVRVAGIVSRIGERGEALAAYNEAVAIYRQLHAETPDDPVIQYKLAATLADAATLQDLDEGLKTSAEALDAYRRFCAAHPDDVDLAAGLALTLANHGVKLVTAGRFPEATECLREAACRQGRLGKANPSFAWLWSEYAGTLGNYAVLLARQDRHAEALCWHLKVVDLREKLLAWRSDDVPRRSALAGARHALGIALRDVGQEEASRQAFAEALEARRQVAQANPAVIRYQVDYALSLSTVGEIYTREKKWKQALPCYQQARQILERQLALDPSSPGLRKLVAEAWFKVGVCYSALRMRPDETDALGRARKILEELVRSSPDHVEYRAELVRTLTNLGINLWVRRKNDDARQTLLASIEHGSKLAEKDRRVVAYWRLLNNARGVLAEIEWRMGNGEASVAQVRARIAMWSEEKWEFFNAACEFSRLLTLESATFDQRRLWSAEALEALRKAVELGFTDLKRMREHGDLAGVRQTPEFEKLAAEVERRNSR